MKTSRIVLWENFRVSVTVEWAYITFVDKHESYQVNLTQRVNAAVSIGRM